MPKLKFEVIIETKNDGRDLGPDWALYLQRALDEKLTTVERVYCAFKGLSRKRIEEPK